MLEYLLDRVAIRTIRRTLRSNAERWHEFDPADVTIFRILLPPEKHITIEPVLADEDEPRWSHTYARSSLFETIALGLRVYWVDQAPTALPGKLCAFFVFRGPFLVDAQLVGEPAVIAGRRTPAVKHDSSFQTPVANVARYFHDLDRLGAGDEYFQADTTMPPPPPPPVPLNPLGYPLPPSDLPGGGTATGESGTNAGSGPLAIDATGQPCTPIYLAYGLLFQGPQDGTLDDPHPLQRELELVLRQFAFRGYGPAPGGAVPPIIRASNPNVANITQMIAALGRLLQRHQSFCICPPDQLVIVVTAHGYGPNTGGNPNNVPAMKFAPDGGGSTSWVTHQQFSQLLGQMLNNLGIAMTKVFVIIYSCRSGDAFNAGRYGANMRNSLIMTAAPDANTFTYVGTFMTCLVQCLRNPPVTSWADLRQCISNCMAGKLVNGKPVGRGGVGRPQQ